GVQSVIVDTVTAIQEDEGWWYLGCRDNEATSNTIPAITSLDLESQTNENTTPNEKQKTNKRPAEGEPGSVFNWKEESC
nr:nucleic acid-binding, OB-fold protein [Tanacetum cinerariifolium]